MMVGGSRLIMDLTQGRSVVTVDYDVTIDGDRIVGRGHYRMNWDGDCSDEQTRCSCEAVVELSGTLR